MLVVAVLEVLVSTLILLFTALLVLLLLLSSFLYVNSTGTDTFTLLFLTRLTIWIALLSSLLFTLLALFFLGLLLRTRALVQGRKVYLTQHVHLRSQLGLTLQCEDFRTVIGLSRCLDSLGLGS